MLFSCIEMMLHDASDICCLLLSTSSDGFNFLGVYLTLHVVAACIVALAELNAACFFIEQF